MINFNTNLSALVSELVQGINNFRPGDQLYDNVIREATVNVLGDMKIRIHQEGKASDGSDIGKYSTKPIYVSVKENPGKNFGRPIGKTGRSVFAGGEKAGEDHSSRYFPLGYDEFKLKIGRNQIGKVNLSLSGGLDNQLTVIENGIGWPNQEMFDRAKALELKYGKPIWAASEQEKQNAIKTAQKLTENAFS